MFTGAISNISIYKIFNTNTNTLNSSSGYASETGQDRTGPALAG